MSSIFARIVARWRSPGGKRTLLGALIGAALASLFFISIVYAWEYTSTSAFCGTTCHTMPVEYTVYQRSAHARVDCVNCHLARGINSAVAQKIGDVRHVIGTIFHNYEDPIVTTSLRPARDVCEKCHWPEKFYADKLRTLQRYQPDAANTETRTFLIMKTQGGSPRAAGQGRGIHWHVSSEVWYIATDPFKQEIPWVEVIEPDGKRVQYLDVENPLPPSQVAEAARRRMDCIDCHNRVSHLLRSPDSALDNALTVGSIDPSLPNIKAKGVELLSSKTTSRAARNQAIADLENYYKTQWPQVYTTRQATIQAAIQALIQIDTETFYPDRFVGWETYPNNIGHKEFPGCFRCHDGKHISSDTTLPPEKHAIRLQCNLCHSIPVVASPGERFDPYRSVLVAGAEPVSHTRGDWMARHGKSLDSTCQTCHGEIKYSPKPTLQNQSFCANVGCHGQGWAKYVKLIVVQDAGAPVMPTPVPVAPTPTPGTVVSPAAPTPTSVTTAPTPTPAGRSGEGPKPAPHPQDWPKECLTCHNPAGGGPKPAPADHAGRTNEMCLVCHQPQK